MATKKITELPLIQTISGSFSVVPIVIGNTAGNGTTDQITIENFSRFVTAYSAHTGSAGNTFTGPQIINSNVTINGRLTVTEVVAQYETASILFSTGSTKLGDELTDKHEFTGSTNITGSLIYNNVLVTNIDANTIQRLQQTTQSLQVATASLQFHSASVDAQLLAIQQTTQSLQVATASLNAFTASQDDRNFVISQFTSSTDAHIVGISAFTSSQLAVNLGNSIYTASVDSHIVGISTYTSSVRDTLARVHQTTQSLQVATASLNRFTASQDDRNFVISQFTSSTDAHIVGISTFTSSQYDMMARVYQTTSSLQSTTASLNQFTASQDSRNFVVSQVTGSLIGITNGLMAFTAALDNTYATDAQLYQLYQSTRSLELLSGSMIGVTNGLMAYTASNSTLNTGLIGEIGGIEAYTASLKGQAIVSSSTQVQNYDVFALNSNLYTSTGSLIGITNGLMAFTAALDNTYATDAQLYQLYQSTRSLELHSGSMVGITNGLMAFTASLDNTFATDAQLYQLYQATQSLELLSGSLIGITNGLMAFTAALDNTYATDAQLYQLYAETASIKAEIAGIEALTASFKAASIVSSSTQIQNYNVFAQTASANTFYGNQFITGGLNVNNGITGSFKGNVDGTATYSTYASTAAVTTNLVTNDTTLYPVFSQNAAPNTYVSLKSHESGSLYYNGVTRQLVMNDGGLVISGSTILSGSTTIIGTPQITGSLLVSGSLTGTTADFETTTGTRYLQIRDAGTSTPSLRSVNNTIAQLRHIAIEANTISLRTGASSGLSVTEALSISATGDVTVSTGNLVMGTSGKGIDFSATSNGSGTTSSELLNDYEEGTFTPTYTGTNLTVVTYGNQFGWYTKVGRLVTVTICLMTEDITVIGSEHVKIGGLPFTSNSTAQASNALIIADSSRWASNPPIAGVITPNTTEVILYKDLGAVGAGTDPTTVKTSDLADATGNRNVVRGTLTYFV